MGSYQGRATLVADGVDHPGHASLRSSRDRVPTTHFATTGTVDGLTGWSGRFRVDEGDGWAFHIAETLVLRIIRDGQVRESACIADPTMDDTVSLTGSGPVPFGHQ